ncbi:MAG: DUF4389 domain-containing protein [Pseudomonadales bacterium]|nr:DUF4389 domain-containing protein [Pseudomonadales bacterium]
MSEELDDLVDNLREPSTWIRVLFMLVFGLVLYLIIVPITLVLALGQALFSIVTGDENDNLRKFGAAMSLYVHQVLRFLTFNSDEKPFPFSDFPGIDINDDIDELDVTEAEDKPKKKKAGKKTAARTVKKTPRKRATTKKAASAEKKEDGSDGEPVSD